MIGKFFFSYLFLPYKLDIFLLECGKYEKPQVHSRAPLIIKKLNVIFHLLTTYLKYKVDHEVCLNSHESI